MKLNRQNASHAIVLGLTAFAFLSSYMHGVEFASQHGAGSAAWGTAAIPELLLISILLRGVMDFKAGVGASLSFALTISVNVAAAAKGPAGLIVALIPPLAAVLCAWFAHETTEAAQSLPAKTGVVADGIVWLKAQKGTLTATEVATARGCSMTSARKIVAAAA